MFKFDKFTERANLALNYALEEAQSLGHTYVGSEHILFGLAKEGTGAAGTALAKFDVTPEAVEKLIQENVGVGLMTNLTFDDFTPRSKRVLQLAVMYAAQLGHGYVGTEHLLLALLDDTQSYAVRFLGQLGVERGRLVQALQEALGTGNMESEMNGRPEGGFQPGQQGGSGSAKTLDEFGRDLTAIAKNGP